MIERIFPKQIGNEFEGHRLALWLLGALLALKMVMSVNSIFNTAYVAVGADGFRLGSYGADGARAVLMLFALTALGQLALTILGVIVLMRYRGLVPLIFVLLLAEHAARRLIVGSYAVERSPAFSAASYINFGILAVLVSGLSLALWRARSSVQTKTLE